MDTRVRLRRGAVLLTGAGLFTAAFVALDLEFGWTPLGVGLAYLGAAIAGGRGGGLWATATVLVGWGLAVVWVNGAQPDVDRAGAFTLGIGLGGVAAVLLSRRGFEVDPLAVPVTGAAAGLILALEPQASGVLGEWKSYALLLAAVGAANLALAARATAGAAPRGGRTSAR